MELNIGGTSDYITFVGKMDYEPNILAVEYFVKHIFINLLTEFPNLQFNIVGAKPSKSVYKLTKYNNVVVTGFVDSLLPYWINSKIIVAPMLTGSGIQNKILQAMAHQCCVMTTSIGAEGLDPNCGLTICNSISEWIKTITILLNNKDTRITCGKIARKYIIDNMSKEIVEKQFSKFLNY
ncbi:MAG: glycosyltransferase [Muribaculaceae bacterium]|nr:glycosyltransferase [Muribaculaceae bacterium]